MSNTKFNVIAIKELSYDAMADRIETMINDGWRLQGSVVSDPPNLVAFFYRPVAVDISTIVPIRD